MPQQAGLLSCNCWAGLEWHFYKWVWEGFLLTAIKCILIWLSITQTHTRHMNKLFFVILLPLFFSCNNPKRIGGIERIDPTLDSVILPGREPEIIADGFTWTEGALWI